MTLFHNSLQLGQELGGTLGAGCATHAPSTAKHIYNVRLVNTGILEFVNILEECGQFSLISIVVEMCVGAVLGNPCQDAAGGKQSPLENAVTFNLSGGQEKNVANVY